MAKTLCCGIKSPFYDKSKHTKIVCLICHKEINTFFHTKRKFCSLQCYYQSLIGKKQTQESIKKRLRFGKEHHNWKGGRVKTSQGYIMIRLRKHPLNQRGYYPEHRLVVEKFLNRYLSKIEEIHHINHIKDDNRLENLYLFKTDREHDKYHGLLRQKHIKPIIKSNLCQI